MERGLKGSAARAIQAATRLLPEKSEILLTTAQLRVRLGGVSEMTIWRYERDPELGFPKPLRIKRRKYWRVRDIEAFEARLGEGVEQPSGELRSPDSNTRCEALR
jgi:predicted DNA-binding transcriptional regulator AlpA